MNVSWFSVFILLILFSSVLIEAVRGYRRGFIRSAISLGVTVVSLMVAILITWRVSDIPASALADYLNGLKDIKKLQPDIPILSTLIETYADALLSPFVLLLVYVPVRGLFAILFAVLYKTALKPGREDAGCAEDRAPSYRRHDRLWGVLAGVLSGYLACLMITMPFIGSFRMAGEVVALLESGQIKLKNAKIPADMYDIPQYGHDAPGMLLYTAGGQLLYNATCVSRLDGYRVVAPHEMENAMSLLDGSNVLSRVLMKGKAPTVEQALVMRGFADKVGASETNRIVMADILQQLSRKWLKGETYFKAKKPSFGEYIDPVFDALLKACSRTTPETAAPNTATLMNVYLIMYENGLLNNKNSSEVQKKLADDRILGSLLAELDKNPAMAGVADAIRNAAMRAMVHKLQSEIAEEAYDSLMQQLTDSINSLSGMPHDAMVEQMTNCAMQYIQDYGINVSSGTVQMVVENIVSDMEGAGGTITPEDLENLFDKYAGGK